MEESTSSSLRNDAESDRKQVDKRIGFAVATLGLLVTALYAVSILATNDPPYGLPEPTPSPIVFLSVIGGPLLATWGWFAARDGTIEPLTPRRSLVAPLVSVVGSMLGIAAFVVDWTRSTPATIPSDTGGPPRVVNPSLLEIVQMEFTGTHLIAIGAVATTIAGTAAARRGRSGLVWLAPPVGVVALYPPLWNGSLRLLTIPVVVLLSLPPFAVGYLAARPD